MSAKGNEKAPQDRVLEITRVYAAPRKLVYEAITEREHIARWMAPKGFTMPVCEGDLRVGGKWRCCMVSPEGKELWLGGVLIPHDKGLSGHSDADVALHAITDALLGTIAEGDIGTHFPPTDPQWRGADSAQFLEHAASLVAARGGIIDFIDLTLICEAPKIGPHRAAMRDRIAALLRLAPGQISVKATTTERLGFAGRGEGIAAQAIATIRIQGA